MNRRGTNRLAGKPMLINLIIIKYINLINELKYIFYSEKANENGAGGSEREQKRATLLLLLHAPRHGERAWIKYHQKGVKILEGTAHGQRVQTMGDILIWKNN